MSLKEQLQIIRESASTRATELDNANLTHARITGARKRAMEEAAKPFDEQLREVQKQIATLEANRPAQLFRSAALDEVVQDVLVLESQYSFGGNDPIGELEAVNYEASLQKNAEKWRYQDTTRILGRVAQFETFIEALQATPSEIPFAAASLHLSEVRDVQADEEGRDSSTGKYLRVGTVVLGRVALNDIFVRRSTSRHVEGVDVILNGMLRIDSELDNYWYEEQTDVRRVRNATITLSGQPTGNSILVNNTKKWDMSNEMPSDDFRVILWGDGVSGLSEYTEGHGNGVAPGLQQLVAEHYERETAI